MTSAFGKRGVALEVSSAGVQVHDGVRPPPDWLGVAAEFGFDLTEHRSTALTRMADDVDLVVAMTADHARSIASGHPALLGRIALFESLACDPSRTLAAVGSQRAFDLLRLDERSDVPDPVRTPLRVQREIARRLVDLSERLSERWPR